jgi:hypothetical protein
MWNGSQPAGAQDTEEGRVNTGHHRAYRSGFWTAAGRFGGTDSSGKGLDETWAYTP